MVTIAAGDQLRHNRSPARIVTVVDVGPTRVRIRDEHGTVRRILRSTIHARPLSSGYSRVTPDPNPPDPRPCTWFCCSSHGVHPHVDRQGKEWAFLCPAHHAELVAAVDPSTPNWTARGNLAAWVKAQGGPQAAAARIDTRPAVALANVLVRAQATRCAHRRAESIDEPPHLFRCLDCGARRGEWAAGPDWAAP